MMAVFWIVSPCNTVVYANVLEEHAASIIRAEDRIFLLLGSEEGSGQGISSLEPRDEEGRCSHGWVN
jgi:hypothetical protein